MGAEKKVLVGALGQAEVEDLGLVAGGYKDVGRLDVAMNDALGMGSVERVGDLDAEDRAKAPVPEADHGCRLLSVSPSSNSMAMKWRPVILTDLVNGADIGVIQGRSGAGFPLKTVERQRVFFGFGRQELERNVAAQVDVLGLVHDPHSSAA